MGELEGWMRAEGLRKGERGERLSWRKTPPPPPGIDGVEDPWRFFPWLLERGVAGGLSLVFPDIALDLFVRALCPASIQIPTARIVRSSPPASHAPPIPRPIRRGVQYDKVVAPRPHPEARAYDADILESATRLHDLPLLGAGGKEQV